MAVTGRALTKQFAQPAVHAVCRVPALGPAASHRRARRLSPKHNPFFAHAAVDFFLARREGEIVGRIAGIDDHLHDETHHDHLAMFGFFEAADQDATRAC